MPIIEVDNGHSPRHETNGSLSVFAPKNGVKLYQKPNTFFEELNSEVKNGLFNLALIAGLVK